MVGEQVLLETVFQSKLHDAVTHMVGRHAKGRLLRALGAAAGCGAGRPSDHLSEIVEVEVQVAVTRGERQQASIGEVEGGNAELQRLALLDAELLAQSQVVVPKHRAAHVGHGGVAQLVIRLWAEATRIGELVLAQAGSRVAQNDREESDIRSTQEVNVVLIGAALGDVEATRLIGAAVHELLPTLDDGGPGKLPAVHRAAHEGVSILHLG